MNCESLLSEELGETRRKWQLRDTSQLWAAYSIVYLKTDQIFSAVLELNFSEIVGIDRLGSSRDCEEFFFLRCRKPTQASQAHISKSGLQFTFLVANKLVSRYRRLLRRCMRNKIPRTASGKLDIFFL